MPTETDTLARQDAKLTPEGGGDGRTIYIRADLVRRFHLDEVRNVELLLAEDDGRLAIVIPLGKGVERGEMRDALESRGFADADEHHDGEFWSITARKDAVEVRMDSATHVAGALLNNVSVRGPVFVIEDGADYALIHEIAQDRGLELAVDDEHQLWSRIVSSAHRDFSDPPTPKEVEPVLERIGTMHVHFSKGLCSLLTTPAEILEWAERVDEASRTMSKKADLRPETPS